MDAKTLLFFSLLSASQLGAVKSAEQHVRRQARNPGASHIPHAPVISTGIASIGYSKRRHILEIEFVSGAVYRYLQVAPGVYRELMTADSKARYYDANIRGKYFSLRMRPRAKQ